MKRKEGVRSILKPPSHHMATSTREFFLRSTRSDMQGSPSISYALTLRIREGAGAGRVLPAQGQLSASRTLLPGVAAEARSLQVANKTRHFESVTRTGTFIHSFMIRLYSPSAGHRPLSVY
jgi:hypothetical protein